MIYSINHFGYENVKDISREVEVHRTVENEVVNRNPPSIQHKWCFGLSSRIVLYYRVSKIQVPFLK